MPHYLTSASKRPGEQSNGSGQIKWASLMQRGPDPFGFPIWLPPVISGHRLFSTNRTRTYSTPALGPGKRRHGRTLRSRARQWSELRLSRLCSRRSSPWVRESVVRYASQWFRLRPSTKARRFSPPAWLASRRAATARLCRRVSMSPRWSRCRCIAA